MNQLNAFARNAMQLKLAIPQGKRLSIIQGKLERVSGAQIGFTRNPIELMVPEIEGKQYTEEIKGKYADTTHHEPDQYPTPRKIFVMNDSGSEDTLNPIWVL